MKTITLIAKGEGVIQGLLSDLKLVFGESVAYHTMHYNDVGDEEQIIGDVIIVSHHNMTQKIKTLSSPQDLPNTPLTPHLTRIPHPHMKYGNNISKYT